MLFRNAVQSFRQLPQQAFTAFKANSLANPQFTASVAQTATPAAKGFIDFTTLGLVKNPLEQYSPQNLPEKLSYGTGAVLAMVNPLNPLNKLGLVLKSPKILGGAFRIAQKPLGKVAGKMIAKGGIKKLLGQGVANVSRGIPFSMGYMLAKKALGQKYTPGNAIQNTAFDFTLGSLPFFGGLLVGAKRAGGKMSAIESQKVLGSEKEIARSMYLNKYWEGLDPNVQIENLYRLTETAQKVIPDVIKTKGMRTLSVQNPREWINVVAKFMEDRLNIAREAGSRVNLGLSTRKLKYTLTTPAQQIGSVGQKIVTKLSQALPTTNKPKLTTSSRGIIPSREEIAASLPNRIDQFIQDTLGYTIQAPVGGSKGATIYTKALRSGQAMLTSILERGLGAKSNAARTAASTLQNFFRGLGMSPARAEASFALRGEMATASQRAYDVATSLYDVIGRNKNSLERINAVLDPAISKIKVAFEQLNPSEQAAYTLIRQGLDLVHDISYANGHISEGLYKNNLGKYTPRMYDVYELPPEVNAFIRQGKKIATDLYKHQKELNDWKIENSLNDPIYSLGKRLAQVEINRAIKKYTDFLAGQAHLISDVKRDGFTQLSDSLAYGAVRGKWILNSAAEDLKGFFFTNEGMQNLYDAFRAYDRMGVRQLQKKILTVFNPTTNVGNIVSDNVFGFLSGVDPLTLNKNILEMKRNPSQYKQLADYLRGRGIVGTDITRTDFTDMLGSIDDLVRGVKAGKISWLKGAAKKVQGAAKKVQSFYGGTDDVYKTAAFKALLDKGYSLEEAIRKVADGFQNYASVGKYYDLSAKIPIVGSAFIKFQGDLVRIIKNAVVNNPLGLIGFLGTLYGIAKLSSKASGETAEDFQTRTQRFGAPVIPGLDIPLTWQTPWGEINVARYISPFFANNEVTGFGKLFPFAPNINPKKDVAANIALNVNDPLLSTPVQLLVDRDFRGRPIADPTENKYQPSTLTTTEKLINQGKFAAGNYFPPIINSIIDVKNAAQGRPNRYGSLQTVPQAIARVAGIKVSQFGPQQAEEARVKDAYYNQLDYQNQNKLIKSVVKDQLEGKIDADTAQKRIDQLQKELPSTQAIFGEKVTQMPDGSFATIINKQLKTFDSPEEAQLAIDKANFKSSGKNLQIVGDNVFRLSKGGAITVTSLIDYQTNLITQKMENAKKADDLKEWLKLAETQYENYQKQMEEPTLDELEKIELQQKIDNLVTGVAKFKSYGGFKKPKKARKITAKKISAPKIKLSKVKIATFKAKAAPKIKAIKPAKITIKKAKRAKIKKIKIKLTKGKLGANVISD